MITVADSQLEGGQVSPNMYPDIAFDLEFSGIDFNSPPDEQKRRIVGRALAELGVVARPLLVDDDPDSVVIPMATFIATPKKQSRLDKFLATSVKRPDRYNGELPTKGSIVEIDDAVNSVVENLAVNKHPVFQLVEQLREMHGLQIGRIATHDVVTEIIMQTKFGLFRKVLDDQLEAWKPPTVERPVLQQFRQPRHPTTVKSKVPKKDRQSRETKQISEPIPRPRARKAKKQQSIKKTSSKPKLPPRTNGVNGSGTNVVKAQSRKLPREGHKRLRPIKNPRGADQSY